MRRHAQHGGERGHLAAQAHRLRPHARFAVRAVGDQHLGACRGHQRHQLLVGQQRVQRLHDAGRLATPERQVVLEAAGQQHRDRILRPHAQRVQQVGGLVDAREQLRIRPADGFIRRVAAAQKGECGLVAEGRAGVAEELVGAAHRERFFQRRFFQPPDVVEPAHREPGAERCADDVVVALVVACCHGVSLRSSGRLRTGCPVVCLTGS
ncbi:hypothetical protein FQZ97_1019390 [compost metagenome]